MGNMQCDNEIQQSSVLAICNSFLNNTWQQLKKKQQIKRLTIKDQNKIYEHFQVNLLKQVQIALPYEQQKKLLYKNNKYICLVKSDESRHKLQGIFFLSNNRIFEGSLIDRIPKGIGKMIFASERWGKRQLVTFEGYWGQNIAGVIYLNQNLYCSVSIDLSTNKLKIEKQHFLVYPNGNIYVGQQRNGLAEGFGWFIWASKGKNNSMFPNYKGQFSMGKRSGKGIYHYTAQKSLEINWLQGKPHGQGILNIGNNQFKVTYKFGKRVFQEVSLIGSD